MKQACGRLRRADIIFIAISSLQVEGLSISSASLSSSNKEARHVLMAMLHAATTVPAGGLAHTYCTLVPGEDKCRHPKLPTCCAAGGAFASLVPLL